MTIQNIIRIHFQRQKILNTRLEEFFKDEEVFLEKNLLLCDKYLFPNKQKKNIIIRNLKSKDIIFQPVQEVILQQNKNVLLPKQVVLSDPKIILFAKVLDLEMTIDSSEIYDTLWASEFEKIYNYNIENGSPIIQIAVGSCHTLLLNNKGKIFSWGWNNYGQCCVSSQSNILVLFRHYKSCDYTQDFKGQKRHLSFSTFRKLLRSQIEAFATRKNQRNQADYLW